MNQCAREKYLTLNSSERNKFRTLNMALNELRVFPYVDQASFHVYLRNEYQLYAPIVIHSSHGKAGDE